MVQAGPGINGRPYLKDNKRKKGWSMAQVIEHLPSKDKTLSSKCSTKKFCDNEIQK
jgi:hypothetical protein